ncbi:hypothetical protein DL767_002430 [Monosporascus sp. MG133]|nr:hypothetical protein DL767_002430 [Monosporascus sp. MG133]
MASLAFAHGDFEDAVGGFVLAAFPVPVDLVEASHPVGGGGVLVASGYAPCVRDEGLEEVGAEGSQLVGQDANPKLGRLAGPRLAKSLQR